MREKIMTLAELYNFYSSQGKNIKFSSKESGKQIVVRVDEQLYFSEDYDPNEGKSFVNIKACHLYENENKTYIAKSVMEEAASSFKGRPILGYIHEVEDGEYDFAGHEYYLDDDDKEVYEEIPVGHILDDSETELVEDEENGKTYLWLEGVVYDEYTKTTEILKKKKTSPVSIEILVDEMTYDSDREILLIEKFHALGVTILGVSRDTKKKIDPGMEGAEISFSSHLTEDDSVIDKEEGGNSKMKNSNETETKQAFSGIRELLEKADAYVNDMYGRLDDTWYRVNVFQPEGYVEMYDASWNDNADKHNYRQNFTYEDDNFELVGDRVEIFSITFTQEEYDAYKENAAKVEEMSADIETLKADKESLEAELAKFKEEPEKVAILEDEVYSDVNETEEFNALKEFDAHCEFSVDELREKCDRILLDYTKKNHHVKFSKTKETKDVPFAPTDANDSFLDKLLKE